MTATPMSATHVSGFRPLYARQPAQTNQMAPTMAPLPTAIVTVAPGVSALKP